MDRTRNEGLETDSHGFDVFGRWYDAHESGDVNGLGSVLAGDVCRRDGSAAVRSRGRCRRREGHVRLVRLLDERLESHAILSRLKQEGPLPVDARLQVRIPTPAAPRVSALIHNHDYWSPTAKEV